MMTLEDVMTIESEDAPEQEYFEAMQRTINSGMWGLQGSYGRQMMAAIEAGYCMLGQSDARDYYGNHIPSRDQVQSGTKGSVKYVADRMGKAYAKRMAAI
jgi:hypothetical protein